VSLDLADPELAALHARLAPYAAGLLRRAGEYAAAQHADEVGPEHLLATMMGDEACAAHRVVLFAFADPETIADEARALSAGILVSGSRTTLPFSTCGVDALEAARRDAADAGAAAVGVRHLLAAAVDALPEAVRGELEAAGYAAAGLRGADAGGADPLPVAGPLFRSFDEDAKQALLRAARLAQGERHDAIGPAHLILAALQAHAELEAAAELSHVRARHLLRGRMADETPPRGGPLPADDALTAFLEGLAAGASSLDLLSRYHAGGTAELAGLLTRHRVGPALLERARGAYTDPEASER